MKQMESLFIKQMEDFSSRIEQSSAPSKATTSSLATELATFRTFIMGALKILQDQFQALSREVDSLEMRSRRKMLLLHGVPEAKGEKTSDLIVQTIVQKLKVVGFTNTSISRCHRMGRPSSADRPRPILLKLRDSEVKNEVWYAKTELKGTGITLSEFLTRARHETFMAARQRFGVAKCWTQDGCVVILGSDGVRHRVSHQQDLDRIISRLEERRSATSAAKEPAAAAVESSRSRRAVGTVKK